jgi:hypothetical protein
LAGRDDEVSEHRPNGWVAHSFDEAAFRPIPIAAFQ